MIDHFAHRKYFRQEKVETKWNANSHSHPFTPKWEKMREKTISTTNSCLYASHFFTWQENFLHSHHITVSASKLFEMERIRPDAIHN